MTDLKLPTIEYLHKRLRYEPETGKLFWRDCEDMPNSWRAKHAGKEAFTAIDGEGYKLGTVNRQTLKAHRVIWTMHYGKWPCSQIDHINGAKTDNRIVNLRVVSNAENARNRPMRSDNTSGVTGVCWNKAARKWMARVCVDGRNNYIGCFDTIAEAAAARAEVLRHNGFTDRHGT